MGVSVGYAFGQLLERGLYLWPGLHLLDRRKTRFIRLYLCSIIRWNVQGFKGPACETVTCEGYTAPAALTHHMAGFELDAP